MCATSLVKGYMCATSWCDLDLTFDLAYLMLFYVSTRISDTLYLSYIFFTSVLVVAPLGVFWCRLSTVKVILEVINCFTFATDGIASSEPQVLPQFHIKACIATSVCMGNIQNIQPIIRPYK